MANQLKQNVVESFKLVKSDIANLKEDINSNSNKQEDMQKKVDDIELRIERLSFIVSELNAKLNTKPKIIIKKAPKKKTVTKTRVITKIVKTKKRKSYIAAKTGKKFHVPHCPFARNIKPKFQVRFKSKEVALNKGFKPCKCV
jgi:hypothetical protein